MKKILRYAILGNFMVHSPIMECEKGLQSFLTQTIEAVATAYYPSPETCDRDYWITATGLDLRKIPSEYRNSIIAVSREAEKIFPMHSQVIIKNKTYYVEDRMAKKIKGVAIDFLMPSREKALLFGRRTIKVKKFEYF